MGIKSMLSESLKGVFGTGKPHADRQAKCPKCKAEVTLGMERCPKCGTHISSMFRIECPKCKTANALDAKKCTKCAYPLAETGAPSGQPSYRCPICGYVANYYMLSCPACGTRFV